MKKYIMHKLSGCINVKSIVAAFEDWRASDYVFKGEMYNFWQFVYVAEGKLGITRDENVFILNQGEIVFHKPFEFHKLWSEGGEAARIIVCSFEAEGEGMKSLENGLFALNSKTENILYKILEHINIVSGAKEIIHLQTLPNPDPRHLHFIKLYLEEFMLLVLDGHNAKDSRQYSSSAANYNNIINVMKENIYNALNVDDIAKRCNLSVSNLKKIFKKYSGGGVMSYFNLMKINEAVRLLKTDMTVGEISELLAYSEQSYFTVAFKRETGLSPLEYRKTALK